MSGYRVTKIVLPILLSIAVSGCASKQAQPLTNEEIAILNLHSDTNQTKIDTYAIIAMDAYERRDYTTASRFFEKLYDLDPQKAYLTDAIKAASLAKEYDRIKRLIEKGKGDFGDDKFINRYLVAYYLDKHETQKAKTIVKKLLAKDPTAKDYELAAILAKIEGDEKEAKRYYRKAYEIDHDPHALLAIAQIDLEQNRTQDAIRILETHTRIYGCDKPICSMLIKIYTQKQDLRALETIYKKLYRSTKDPLYANALLELYAYERRYDDAIAFLKKSRFDDEALLDVYTAKKDYKNARKIADELYQKTLDPKFLAKAAILEYESSPNKSKKVLHDVIEKFEKSVYQLDDPLYYNYYAYLLIDHDIDIEKGIELVKKALRQKPDSLYYIDTLAWGYYKQGKCKEAYKLMQPYEKEDEPEISEHIEKIKACLKNKNAKGGEK
jgi:predicted Zn-dependent protease